MNGPRHHDSRDGPRVSIVIPTRNRRGPLERCLQALAGQSVSDFEVLIVDDGSSDETPRFLADFAAAHPELRLRSFRSETRRGANPSRNLAIRESRAEYVAFLDDDCVPRSDWLACLLNGFADANVAAVTGLVLDSPPQNIYELTYKGTHRLHRPGDAHRLVAGNLCVRRRLLLEHGLDEDRADAVTEATDLPAQSPTDRARPAIEDETETTDQPAQSPTHRARLAIDGEMETTSRPAQSPTVSGRSDEEGLFLRLRAAGCRQVVALDAVVVHEHRFTAGSFFRQALRGGQAAARLVYKYRLPPRLDMLPFILAYALLPLVLVGRPHAWAPPAFFAAALAAVAYNDLVRKGKTVGETLRSFPVLVAYYHVRLLGYVTESLRLRFTSHDLRRVRLPRRRSEAYP